MPYPAARDERCSTRALSRIGVETAYWLFSSTKITGRSQMAARFMRLVPHPVGRRAIAAEREHDLGATTLLDGKRGTRRDAEAAGDDAIGAQVADRPTRDVHRSAAAMAVAGLLAEQLGHHPARVMTLRDGMAVSAVGADDVVVGLDGRDRADGDALLAEVRVEVPADVPEAVLLDRSLFEASDRQRRLVHPLGAARGPISLMLRMSPLVDEGFCGKFARPPLNDVLAEYTLSSKACGILWVMRTCRHSW